MTVGLLFQLPDRSRVEHAVQGLNLRAQPREATDLDRLVRDSGGAGVIVTSETEWFSAEPTAPFIRLNRLEK